MKQWKVVIAEVVQHQVDEQVLFIAGHSIENALAWEERVNSKIKELASVTGYAVDQDASERMGFEVHKLVFEGTYLIHYTLDEPGSLVRVINFRHGARLPRRGEP